ncbi:MAG: hypothetical protein WC375_11480 [Methanomassiliicoccales archaeon]|jgi:hypothetical protein
MNNGLTIKTTLNNVPVELMIISMGPADPTAIAAVQAQIANEGIQSSSLQQSQPSSSGNPVVMPAQLQPQIQSVSQVTPKSWVSSRTLWFNALAITAAIAAQYGYNGEVPKELQELVPVGIAVMNIVLRFISKSSISVPKIATP